MALCGGADLVVELPALFATSSAEDFAACGVSLLSSLGTDFLCFGSESGNLSHLQKAAEILSEESAIWQSLLQTYLKQGETYPSARSLAVAELTGAPGLSTLLATPNNILAVEYLKALKQQESSMIPVTIRRRGCGYHDTEFSGPYASASAIRLLLSQSAVLASLETLCMQIPPAAFDALLKEGALAKPVFPDDLSELLQFRLLSAVHRKEDLNRFLDFSSDLAARLTRQVLHFAPFSEQIMQLKTKGYTYTRVSRALLHLLLDITKEQSSQAKGLGYAPYARILGFKKSAGPLLSHLRRQSRIPLITKTADAKKLLSPEAMKVLETDFYVSHIYQSLLASRGRLMRNEYTKSVIVL